MVAIARSSRVHSGSRRFPGQVERPQVVDVATQAPAGTGAVAFGVPWAQVVVGSNPTAPTISINDLRPAREGRSPFQGSARVAAHVLAAFLIAAGAAGGDDLPGPPAPTRERFARSYEPRPTSVYLKHAAIAKVPALVLTEVVIARGGREMNDLMERRPVRITATLIVYPVVHVLACKWMERRSPKWALRVSRGLAVLGMIDAARNAHVLIRQ